MNSIASVAAPSQVASVDREAPPASVLKILGGALSAIIRSGTRRLSMSDISEISGVSRGTLYRYFPSKEAVLEAVGEFVSLNFEAGIQKAADSHADPIEKLRAVMRFHRDYTNEQSPGHVLEVEPAFHLAFFRSHFPRHLAAVREALSATFKWLEGRLGCSIDGDVIAELLIRLQLSTLIIPAERRWADAWNGTPAEVERWITLVARLPTGEN